MSKDMILINNIYTGDYTNKNIGHEIINLYKTDKREENYIYISPWGKVPKEKLGIQKVIFVRGAGAHQFDIIGYAEGLEYWGKEKPKSDLKKSLIKKLLDEENISENELNKKYQDNIKNFLKKKEENEEYYKTYYTDTYIDLEIHIKSAFDVIREKIKDKYKEDAHKKGIQKIRLDISNEKLEKKDEIEKDIIKNYKKDIEKLNYNFGEYIHNLQLKYIKQNKIKYNGSYINKVFDDNYHSVPPIYLTFRAKEVKKAKKPFLIDYSPKGKYYTIFKDNNPRNRQCVCYMEQKQLESILKNIEWIDTKELKKSEYNEYKETFLDIIEKSYDELVFSNMFVYYFDKDKDLFEKFRDFLTDDSISKSEGTIINKETKEKLDDLEIDKTFEISREVKVDQGRIDIQIKTDNSLFVIENKVKSGINSERYDHYTEEYSNQLTNYYNHYNNSEIKEKELKNIEYQHYFIFAPNHNKIDKEKIKENMKNDESCKIIDQYNIVTYRDLLDFFKKHTPRKIRTREQKIYYNDFLKVLEYHSSDNDNRIERVMEYKFRQAIKHTKENRK